MTKVACKRLSKMPLIISAFFFFIINVWPSAGSQASQEQ
jgi:hypothetical protein